MHITKWYCWLGVALLAFTVAAPQFAYAQSEVDAETRAKIEAEVRARIEAEVRAEIEAEVRAKAEERAKAEAASAPKGDVAAALDDLDPLARFFARSKPTLDMRARWESADQTHKDDANAQTLRIRLGLLSPKVEVSSLWNGFEGFEGALQGFIEYEGTEAARKHGYNVPNTQGDSDKVTIADPSSHELNRAWLSFAGYDNKAKYGRQRIILDNARFVGNVGWRQNEQTYDSVRLTNNMIEDLTLDYTYVWQVQRIFGSKASRDDAQGDYDSQTHLINATFTGIPYATVKAYGYFMDLENNFTKDDLTKGPGNKTYGASIQGAIPVDDFKLGYYGEWARQSDYGGNWDSRTSTSSYHSTYYHVNGSVGYEGYKAGAGWEHLGQDSDIGFQTPLATLHKFNGWADVFLSTPTSGLVDRYAWVEGPLPFDAKFKAVYHRFDPDSSSGKFGDEYDLLLTKKLFWGITGLTKVAFYNNATNDSGGVGDNITRFWLEVSYKYN
jgi:hypothetical protein